jgi:hypothetical protein
MESAEMLLLSPFICRFSEIETEEQEDLLFRNNSMKKQSCYRFVNHLGPHKNIFMLQVSLGQLIVTQLVKK